MNLATLTLLGLATVAGQAPTSPSSAAGYDALRSRSFQIPIDYVPERRKDIQQVMLVVSSNRGQTWETVAATTPDKPSFNYTAPDDGLYWVNMVIVYRDGKREPENVALVAPAAKLLVDSTSPTVRIVAANRIGEEIVVDWMIEDKFPNDASTQITYRPVGSTESAWLPVPPSAINKRSVKFKPENLGPIQIQVAAQDLAGNTAVATKNVAGGTTTAVVNSTPYTNPVAPAMNTETPALQPPTLPMGESPLVAPKTLPPPVIPPATAIEPPVMTATTPLAPAPVPTPTPAVATSAPPGGWQPAAGPVSTPVDAGAPRPIAVGSGVNSAPTEAVPGAQVVNFLRFDLQYQLENGPSGVRHVDLYVTRDDGRTWGKWSQHDGRESPIRVQLDTRFNTQPEGDYGFRLVPVSGAGLTDGAPTAGSTPEMRVHVDTTPPVIKVYAPTADPNQRNTLLLHWEATDRNFGKDPIAIEWSEQPSGPWKPVTGGDAVVPVLAGPGANTQRIANTGSFPWALPPGLATHRVYLRFTAWDTAGNKSEVVTPSPVMVDLTKPRAKIQGILGAPTIVRQ